VGGWASWLEGTSPPLIRFNKLDVTWRDVEGHRLLRVFEVEFSGDVDRA
jgi:hypothetical protein